MDSKEYLDKVLRTEMDKEGYSKIYSRLNAKDLTMLRILFNRVVHVSTQIDVLKKKMLYNKSDAATDEALDFMWSEHGYLEKHLEANDHTFRNLNGHKELRLLHAIMGIVGESGELADAYGKFLRYGALDEVNLKEETGDLNWYQAVLMDAIGVSQDDVYHSNINKLRARYGTKYSDSAATNRDLQKERTVLEAK